LEAGRQDLIGSGCDCLIPANPPKEAIEAKRRQANRAFNGGDGDDHYHTILNAAVRLRYPADADVRKGPVKLSGWNDSRLSLSAFDPATPSPSTGQPSLRTVTILRERALDDSQGLRASVPHESHRLFVFDEDAGNACRN
jgi:hypothetical protein